MMENQIQSSRILQCKSCGIKGNVVHTNRDGVRYWHVFFNEGCDICSTPIDSSALDDYFIRKSNDITELEKDDTFTNKYIIVQ